MQPPSAPTGLQHVALLARNLERTVQFYRDLLGFQILDQPVDAAGTCPATIDRLAGRHRTSGTMTDHRMICLFPTDSTCRDNGLSTQHAGATGSGLIPRRMRPRLRPPCREERAGRSGRR